MYFWKIYVELKGNRYILDLLFYDIFLYYFIIASEYIYHKLVYEG